MTAAQLAAVLAELGNTPIRISVAPSGIYVHAPADYAPPLGAVCHRDYEVTEFDYRKGGDPLPVGGYPTESWRWSRQAGSGVVHIWTAARRCGPLERWRV